MDMTVQTDWGLVEQDFRAGQLSLAAICDRYNIHRSALNRKAEEGRWERDLAGLVRQQTQDMLMREQYVKDYKNDDAVMEAANRAVAVALGHRRDAAKLRSLVDTMAEALARVQAGTPNPGDMLLLGKAGGTAETLIKLATALDKLIGIERAAFGLDGPVPSVSVAMPNQTGGQTGPLVSIYLPENGRNSRDG